MRMTTPCICIPYFTGAGHTARLAQAIAAGMAAPPRLIDVAQIAPADWQALDAAPAILFGAPTYMGSAAAEYGLFLEEASSRWTTQGWQDKLAGGFTVATFPSGDKLATLQRLAIYAAQMGMVWIGPATIGAPVNADAPGLNASGSWLGLAATSSRDKTQMISDGDAETARLFGARFEAAARRWHR